MCSILCFCIDERCNKITKKIINTKQYLSSGVIHSSIYESDDCKIKKRIHKMNLI